MDNVATRYWILRAGPFGCGCCGILGLCWSDMIRHRWLRCRPHLWRGWRRDIRACEHGLHHICHRTCTIRSIPFYGRTKRWCHGRPAGRCFMVRRGRNGRSIRFNAQRLPNCASCVLPAQAAGCWLQHGWSSCGDRRCGRLGLLFSLIYSVWCRLCRSSLVYLCRGRCAWQCIRTRHGLLRPDCLFSVMCRASHHLIPW
jgi:hypothetical protein